MKLPARLSHSFRRALLLAAALLVLWLPLPAQNLPTMTASALSDDQTIKLHEATWKFRAGDDAAWAATDFPDDDWKLVTNADINRDAAATLENWRGRGWFRLRVQVDRSLTDQPLALRIWHWGASEIYLDGKLVQKFGAISAGDDSEFNPRGQMIPFVFADAGAHVIAVRYSFQAASDLTGGTGRWLAAGDALPGFLLYLHTAQAAAERIETRAHENSLDYVFAGLLFALAFVHFLLFAFYPRARGNLFYSLFDLCLGATFVINRLVNDAHLSAIVFALLVIAQQTLQAVGLMSLLTFLYAEFAGKRFSKFYWILSAWWIVCLILTAAHVSLPFPYYLSAVILTLADAVRIIADSLVKRKPGAINLAAGVAVLVCGVANNVAFERGAHFLPESLHPINLYLTIFAVPVAVSIYLARSFAQTNQDLQTQLVRAVEHEKERARLEIVEAENQRRAEELEEARQLQLSLLPKKLPQIANFDIAAYMKPATEVGGDYYDFHVGADKTLTIAVGDATGHGLKAGSVVTATKSLFNAFAGEDDIAQILRKCSAAIKKMNLRGMFMALTVAKIKDDCVKIGVAGMPPALFFRAATQRVEEYAVKALPLGAPRADYEHNEFCLANGDLLVLMSDGFPEMFNDQNEMLGFDQAARILPAVASRSAQQIVDSLVQTGSDWANGRPQDDDVTFVVIKVAKVSV